MNTLTLKALAGFLNLFAILCLSLFLPAWSLDFWEAWAYLLVFFGPVMFITLYFLRKDPQLIVPGFDHRFHWSHVHTYLIVGADVVVLFGFVIVFFVFKENSYTSATIEVAANQYVISTGLYSVVRHPMYSGGLLLMFFTPLALGSWWALPFALPMFVVIILRLLDEEKVLLQSLTGYKEYCQKVHYRLIPRIW